MEIRIAAAAVFCFGVQRALEMVEDLLQSGADPIYLLGPLIHNPQVMEDLAARGIQVVNRLDEANAPGTLVIRTHGVPDRVIEAARQRGLKVVDAICPRVRSVHKLGRRAEAEGRLVLLFGEREHPEVRGIAGNLQECRIFENLMELESMNLPEKLCLLAQTTQNVEDFQVILAWLQKAGHNVRHHDTICAATRQRQDAAATLARDCDLIIVIGGRESGNTQRLYHICREITATIQIEICQELEAMDLSPYDRIGITAGASTPDHLLQQVADYLSTRYGGVRV